MNRLLDLIADTIRQVFHVDPEELDALGPYIRSIADD
jgi:hypothetical protein